ncbi:hypothetical protein MNBD_GAMMA16-1527 [hydrothermal vent metagenome]|uniref:Uncharacterized protein n=1 Tax=hydrothermal vent metagenome TaxID=652676 RepID=A0A3B0Z855_9ZZZZ
MYVFNSKITDGTNQAQREPLAFRSAYFNVDEMSFEVLLSMASQYAGIFSYYNTDNQKKGSWEELFSANEVVIMALISTYDVLKIEYTFTQLDISNLQVPAEHVMNVAVTLDFWLKRLSLSSTESASVLRSNIHDMIKANLLPGLHTAADVAFRSRKNLKIEMGIDVRELSPVWGVIRDGEHNLYPHADRIDLDDSVAVMHQLESTLFKMTGSVQHLKTLTNEMLERSLQNQSHEPAIGLYMVFLRLYEVAQKRLNRFTSRHLDFYYRTCLQTAPQSRQTESLFLRFSPTPSAAEFIVDERVYFSAKKNPSAGDRSYNLAQPLLVRQANINTLCTLYFQRNSLVSPECELGHVTRIKSYKRTRLPANSELDVDSMPLFGNAKKRRKQRDIVDADFGFCIASPILALKEGRRQIELTIRFTMPNVVAVAAEFDEACHIDSSEAFIPWFGRVFSIYLLGGEVFFNAAQRDVLAGLVEKYGGDNGVYNTLLKQPWQDLFYHLLSNSFAIKLSGESGWLAVKDYLVSPIIQNDNEMNSGLKIILFLGQDVEPVLSYNTKIHGGNRCSNVPMMDVCLDSEAGFFSYSLLNSVPVKSIELEVTVNGIKDLFISNHLGRLDPAKPFAPLGSNPSRNSYFVFGSREAAGKQVTAMELDLEWGELPTISGGFSSYYEGYDFIPLNSSFKAELSVLQNGHWMPSDIAEQHNVSLFKSDRGGVLSKKKVLNIAAIDYFKPRVAAEKIERYEFHTNSRNGFVRLQLSSPDNAFAHADYPQLMTRILSENVRKKKSTKVPNVPYTPLIQKISLNYKARTLLKIGIDSSPNTALHDEIFFHIHPFGVDPILPSTAKSTMRLFPVYNEDGNLFIGIDAQEISGVLTIFFTLDEDSSTAYTSKKPEIYWRCLTTTGWVKLEGSRVRSDTTEGFLMSGVVTLDLPQDMINTSLLMPQGQYWLHVSAHKGLQDFGGLRSVHCNVGQISCVDSEVHHDDSDRNVSNNFWRTIKSVPGLDKVSRIGQTSGGRSAENERRYRTRISERLRHKGRASTAWDYERLILEHFPNIFKVKCFANTVCHEAAPQPGHVLIVVVPYMERDARSNCERGMVNGAELSQIQSFIQKIGSSFVRVEVRNPFYEQIQVRCTVKFSGDNNAGGLYINRLNQDISEYICPWCDVGYKANFGWTILGDDIESYIRELDYIDFVTDFSMLHISEDSGEKYFMVDSATLDSRHEALIRPRYPWSLAMPMRRHFIENTTSMKPVKAQMTGINELAIGSTFIISGN